MGWGGGTEIFDCVVDDLLEAQLGADFDSIVYNLYQKLCEQDWDNFCESKHYMSERVMLALDMEDEFEEWFEEQENDL
jgi:hypothetical protein